METDQTTVLSISSSAPLIGALPTGSRNNPDLSFGTVYASHMRLIVDGNLQLSNPSPRWHAALYPHDGCTLDSRP